MRRDIQGLRAIAVVAVLLFHLWPNRLPGGYVGVDVFFVISGFLITSHLLREVDGHGRVRLREFWARRIRRLLPAALLVLVASAAATVAWVPQGLWPQFMKEILAAGLYVENWVLAADSVDYLAADNSPSPAQHYWTLSAEEQFYLAWPLLVAFGLLLSRRLRAMPVQIASRRTIGAVLGVVTVGSLVWALVLTATDPAAAYFVTQARAWEFGAGALIAFCPATSRAPRLRATAAWAGVSGIVACSLTFSESTPMPGTAAILVVAAAALVIVSDAPDLPWSTTRVMSPRPVQLTGDISYSLYLWHWPLIVIAPWALSTETVGRSARLTILVATFVLAWATKRWVEDRFRAPAGRRAGHLRRTYVGALAGALALCVVSGVPWIVADRAAADERDLQARVLRSDIDCLGAASTDPRKPQCPDDEVAGQLIPDPSVVADDRPSYPGCEDLMLGSAPLRHGCRFGDPSDESVPHLAVIGDSHARALMPAIEELADSGVLTAELFYADACPWATGEPNWPEGRLYENCLDYRDRLEPFLRENATRFDAVVTTSWADLAETAPADQVRWTVEAWQEVSDQDVPIVALRDNPMPGRYQTANPNLCLEKVDLAEANAQCSFSRGAGLDDRFSPLPAAVDQVSGATLVDLSDRYCTDDTCPVVIGGVNVYRDANHVTSTYMRTLAPYLLQGLRTARVLPG